MEFDKDKQIVFSGVQPSGVLTIGNYLGAIKNWKTLEDKYNCIYCVVNQHAITVRQDPAELRRRTYETLAIYIASGLDPEKNLFFVQSHVPAHAELAWVLNCYTMFGELSRMTQFKDKSSKHSDNVNAGLFTYPVLMAADILLYNTSLVPVGMDQKQHIEITRDIAKRFNDTYSETFTIPEPYFMKSGTKICSLTDPTKKMSKSDENENSRISLLDSRDDIVRKFKRAVTDSGSEVKYAEGKDGINNLMNIYSCLTGKTIEEIEKEFEGKGYGEFKLAVGETCADSLSGLQSTFNSLMNDKSYLETVMKNGSDYANYLANKMMSKVYRKLGFLQIK